VTPRQRKRFAPVTLGHMRGHGCRDVLIYCESVWCRHKAIMNVDVLPDDTPVRSLCGRTRKAAAGFNVGKLTEKISGEHGTKTVEAIGSWRECRNVRERTYAGRH
jgi:hypothetical protein